MSNNYLQFSTELTDLTISEIDWFDKFLTEFIKWQTYTPKEISETLKMFIDKFDLNENEKLNVLNKIKENM